jgi:hypothetical protein
MFSENGGKPNDRRGFVHKTLLGAVGGAVKGFVTGGPTGALAGGVKSLIKQPARATVSRTVTARPGFTGSQEKEFGRGLKFGGSGALPEGTRRLHFGGEGVRSRAETAIRQVRSRFAGGGNGNGDDGCVFPARRDPGTGRCKIFLGERAGPDGGAPVGDAVMGRHGAALEPGIMTIDRAVCLRGMVLGNDGLCYNKRQISNRDRMWPRGRAPLLTGGEMRAISIAARAGGKVERTTKRLRKLGMMKAPPARRALPRGRGSKSVTIESGPGSVVT